MIEITKKLYPDYYYFIYDGRAATDFDRSLCLTVVGLYKDDDAGLEAAKKINAYPDSCLVRMEHSGHDSFICKI